MARLLMIISSAGCIDLASEKGRETGYSVDEMLKPYDKFLAAGVEVVAATPDGESPHADPFTLEPRFHYPDEDKDFLSQVMRSFSPDLNDIRVTLHHLTELDLIAARRVSQALTMSGLDHNNVWRFITRAARTAWREDRNFIEVLADDPEVTDKLSLEHLQALTQQVRDESVACVAYKAERLAAIETLRHPRNLSQMSDEEILSFDAVFLPGDHGAMVGSACQYRCRAGGAIAAPARKNGGHGLPRSRCLPLSRIRSGWHLVIRWLQGRQRYRRGGGSVSLWEAGHAPVWTRDTST